MGFFDGIGTGLLSLAGGLFGQSKTDDRLQQQMDFQRQMSNTAYQRAMADMRKAGLNPMLAYSKGGASTPAGAFAPASDILTPAVSTAMQQNRLTQELKNMEETNKNIEQQTQTSKAQESQSKAQTALIGTHNKIQQQVFQSALAEAAKAKTDEEFFNSTPGKVLRILGLGLGQISPHLGPMKGTVTVQPYQGGN